MSLWYGFKWYNEEVEGVLSSCKILQLIIAVRLRAFRAAGYALDLAATPANKLTKKVVY